jgi:hypothetical protein
MRGPLGKRRCSFTIVISRFIQSPFATTISKNLLKLPDMSSLQIGTYGVNIPTYVYNPPII